MKLSFNTGSIQVFRSGSRPTRWRRRSGGCAIGYDGIEIGAAAPHAYPAYMSPERRREIRTVLDDNNIVVSAMLPAPGGGPGFNVASPIARGAAGRSRAVQGVAQLCADLGGDTLLYVAGWVIYGTEWKQAFAWSRGAGRDRPGGRSRRDRGY